jgi:hypothetical protein
MTAHEFLDKEYFYLIIDSRGTDIYSEDIEQAMQKYAKLKCKQLLDIVAEKAQVTDYGYAVSKDSVLNAVDLDKFIV